jgi:hypothetical protein
MVCPELAWGMRSAGVEERGMGWSAERGQRSEVGWEVRGRSPLIVLRKVGDPLEGSGGPDDGVC